MRKAINADPMSVLSRVYVGFDVVDKQAVRDYGIGNQSEIFRSATPRHVFKSGELRWSHTFLNEQVSDCAKSCLVDCSEHHDARKKLAALLEKLEKPRTCNLAYRVRNEGTLQVNRQYCGVCHGLGCLCARRCECWRGGVRRNGRAVRAGRVGAFACLALRCAGRASSGSQAECQGWTAPPLEAS